MFVWKVIFLFQGCSLRFHANFAGCTLSNVGIQCVVNKMNPHPGCCYQASFFFSDAEGLSSWHFHESEQHTAWFEFWDSIFLHLHLVYLCHTHILKISNVSISLDISRFKKNNMFYVGALSRVTLVNWNLPEVIYFDMLTERVTSTHLQEETTEAEEVILCDGAVRTKIIKRLGGWLANRDPYNVLV